MFRFIRQIAAYALLLLTFSSVPALARELNAQSQDRVTVNKELRFQRSSIGTTVSGRIARDTTHRYRVQAREGQQMAVVLKTGNKTSLTIYGNSAGILEGADEVRRTLVELPETGEFLIEIGTDANANYTLEVTIK